MGYAAVPTLMFVTLAIVLIGLGIHFARFYRKPENRHPMKDQRERNTDEIRRGDPPKPR